MVQRVQLDCAGSGSCEHST